mmetsp:Transcript_35753/g.102786  ORF Transcript_35753/g.102786 Transcript_35753/m.102786 type:complete len:226 (+) Transcript_35753:451-1128(+)
MLDPRPAPIATFSRSRVDDAVDILSQSQILQFLLWCRGVQCLQEGHRRPMLVTHDALQPGHSHGHLHSTPDLLVCEEALGENERGRMGEGRGDHGMGRRRAWPLVEYHCIGTIGEVVHELLQRWGGVLAAPCDQLQVDLPVLASARHDRLAAGIRMHHGVRKRRCAFDQPPRLAGVIQVPPHVERHLLKAPHAPPPHQQLAELVHSCRIPPHLAEELLHRPHPAQ